MGCQFNKPPVQEPQKIKPVDDIIDIPKKKDTEIQSRGTKVQNETSVKQFQTQHQVTQVSNKSQSGELILYPQTTDNLQTFIKLGMKMKLIHLQTRNKYINTVDEIISQIQKKSLKFSTLQSLCQKQNLKVMDAMFLRNDSEETILTLILTYIDDYEIITELLINHKLPENNFELLDLAVSLLRKLRPQSQINKIQTSIEFLDTVQKNVQLKRVFNSFEDPKIYRVKNAIMYAQNCISYFNHKKWIHLLLFRKIAKLFDQSLGGLFLRQYRSWKQKFAFNHLKVPKAIAKSTSTVTNLRKIELEMLNYSLFHEIAIKENWELFVQYSNPYYHQKSLDQRTPFWIFFQKAPISIIVNYIQQYPKQLDQNISYITTKGLTLIHCLCKNLNLKQSDQETIKNLITILEKNSTVKTLLSVAYQDQIPIVYYLDTQRVISSDMVKFLSSGLVKQFPIDNLEMESYKIADSILQGKLSLRKSKPHFSKLSKVQLIQLMRKKQWHFFKDEQDKQSKEYQNFTSFYQQYVQLAKQIIKNDLFDQFPWIQNYSLYSSHIPYEIGNLRTSLLYTLLVSNRFQQLKIQIESICKSIESQQYQQKSNPQEYQTLVQQISKVLFIYQELFNYPEQQELQQLILDTIYNKIQQNPQIISNKIYGFLKYESMADNLYLQYIMRIKAQKEEYMKFINMLIERLDKNLFKGRQIQIKILFKNYSNFERYKLNLLEKLLPQQDQLIIPLEIQIQNIIQDSVNEQNFQNYYDFKNILQEIMDKDDEFNFFIKGRTVILRSNSICQTLLDNSKLHQLYRGSFFRLEALWRTSQSIQYNKSQIIPYILHQQNLVVQINKLEQNQFEQLFDWQLYGMRVKLNLKIKQTLAKLSLKEQVIYNQIKSNQQFWINLIIYDDLNTEVTEYFNRDEHKPQLITYEYFPLSEIISNNSFKNLQYLIELKKISQYELVHILADQFFYRQTSVVFYQPIKEKIQLFNVQMKLLIEQVSTNTYEIQQFNICIVNLKI